jgi:hypothetical protein
VNSKPFVHISDFISGSGLVFGFTYCLSYTCARTLANTYDYNALSVGLVLLCLGLGDVFAIWIVAED